MPAESENSSNVLQVTRNKNPNPEIGWVSKVPDNHYHKSFGHINLWPKEVLQTAEMRDKVPTEKQGPSPDGKRQHSIIRMVS
jgi:hypothetical protein